MSNLKSISHGIKYKCSYQTGQQVEREHSASEMALVKKAAQWIETEHNDLSWICQQEKRATDR